MGTCSTASWPIKQLWCFNPFSFKGFKEGKKKTKLHRENTETAEFPAGPTRVDSDPATSCPAKNTESHLFPQLCNTIQIHTVIQSYCNIVNWCEIPVPFSILLIGLEWVHQKETKDDDGQLLGSCLANPNPASSPTKRWGNFMKSCHFFSTKSVDFVTYPQVSKQHTHQAPNILDVFSRRKWTSQHWPKGEAREIAGHFAGPDNATSRSASAKISQAFCLTQKIALNNQLCECFGTTNTSMEPPARLVWNSWEAFACIQDVEVSNSNRCYVHSKKKHVRSLPRLSNSIVDFVERTWRRYRLPRGFDPLENTEQALFQGLATSSETSSPGRFKCGNGQNDDWPQNDFKLQTLSVDSRDYHFFKRMGLIVWPPTFNNLKTTFGPSEWSDWTVKTYSPTHKNRQKMQVPTKCLAIFEKILTNQILGIFVKDTQRCLQPKKKNMCHHM